MNRSTAPRASQADWRDSTGRASSVVVRPGLFSLAVALTSGASLSLSLLFTRILSVTAYYHFAFLLISLALLGIAVSGVAVYLLPGVFRRERLPALAGIFATALALLSAFALAVAVSNPISLDLQGENLLRIGRVYAALALPFLASGFAITCAISAAGEHIGRVYAFDLTGAGLGCLAVVSALSLLGGPAAVVAAGAVGAAGGLLFGLAAAGELARWTRWAGALSCAGGLALAIVQARTGEPFGFAQSAKFLREEAVVYERWNGLARVTVSTTSDPDHMWIHIDADAATRMFSGAIAAGGYEAPRRFSEVRVAALVYALRKEGPALIIGPGGGPDVISALRAGVPRVVGVEVNPAIAREVMRDRYSDYNGDLYGDPRVQIAVDDGRSFVRRSPAHYASIQATLVDTWAASAAGAFTLSENNLYTVEAFTEYLSRLTPPGILSMTRWYLSPPREFLRLVALARAALESLGVPPQEIPRHVFVASDARMATLLVKRTPFAAEELAVLRTECARTRLSVLQAPEGSTQPLLGGLLAAPDPAAYLDRLAFDATPTTDDRPFFFFSLHGRDFPRVLARAGALERNDIGLAILQLLLLLSTGLTIGLVVLPLLLFRRRELARRGRATAGILAYFLALGLGFILVEVGLMQRFILFLGHPLYALAVVLATLLGASGAGAAASPRLGARYGDSGAIGRAISALALVLLLYCLLLGPLFQALLGLSIGARIALAAALVAVPGFFMGQLLPAGVRIATRAAPGIVPWAWGLNGATSVLGSIAATALSMLLGFTATLLAGLAAYVAGAAVLVFTGTAAEQPAP